mgnify:CR=1 FL=1
MKGLFRKRGGGKTTALVYTSAITGYPIVVPTTISKRYVKDVARRVGVSIPEPIVMSEDARDRRIGGVLIERRRNHPGICCRAFQRPGHSLYHNGRRGW